MFDKRLKQYESSTAIAMAKKIIANFTLDYLDLNDILIIRSPIQDETEEITIHILPSVLIKPLGYYYYIKVMPTFDLLSENNQYRLVYHCLRHIPKDYKNKPDFESHDVESFDKEYMFTETFKQWLK